VKRTNVDLSRSLAEHRRKSSAQRGGRGCSERYCQNAVRRDLTLRDEKGNPSRYGGGFAAARSGQDTERSLARGDHLPLLR